jgi:hypothetical protein
MQISLNGHTKSPFFHSWFSQTKRLRKKWWIQTKILFGRKLLESFLLRSFLWWGETESTWYVGHIWPIVPAPDDRLMSVEQSLEWELAGQTEVFGENLLQCHFVHHKSHMTWPGLEPGPSRWKAGDYAPELRHGLLESYFVFVLFRKLEAWCPKPNLSRALQDGKSFSVFLRW